MNQPPDTGFSLAPLVRSVVDDAPPETSLDDLAMLVLEQIARYDHETALFQALRVVVGRPGFRPAFIPEGVERREAPVEPPAQGKTKAASKSAQAATPPVRSAKVASIASAWQRTLDQRIVTASGPKALGDCTTIDLEHAASLREKQAKHAMQRASDLRALAALMTRHGAAVLRDVPSDALADGLRDVA